MPKMAAVPIAFAALGDCRSRAPGTNGHEASGWRVTALIKLVDAVAGKARSLHKRR